MRARARARVRVPSQYTCTVGFVVSWHAVQLDSFTPAATNCVCAHALPPQILALAPHRSEGVCPNIPGLVEVDVSGMAIVPGFVDCHVHVTGGGGEAGFQSRTPEAQQGELINAGVTAFVAVLGTDTVTRGTENMLAKTRGLAACGLTGYAWLGGYQYPPLNDLTGSTGSHCHLPLWRVVKKYE